MAKKTPEEKRRQTNIENLIRYFDPTGQGCMCEFSTEICAEHRPYLKRITPQDILNICRLMTTERQAFDVVVAYARKFKQAASEINEEDILAAIAELEVKQVMLA